jgi:chromosome segregation ATPase
LKEEREELRRQFQTYRTRTEQNETKLQRQMQLVESQLQSANDERDAALYKSHESQNAIQTVQGENRQLNVSLDVLEKKVRADHFDILMSVWTKFANEREND